MASIGYSTDMGDPDVKLLVGILLVVALAVAGWYFRDELLPQPEQPVVAPSLPAVAEPVEDSGPRHPILPPDAAQPGQRELVPLPSLDDSDAYFLLALVDVFGADIESLLVKDGLIDRIVTTVDNLPRDHVAEKIRPVGRLPDFFQADTSGDNGPIFLSPENYRRYDQLVGLVATADVDAIVDASKDSLDMLDVYYHSTVPVKIIFLTRDSRGNVWSMLKRLKPGMSREDNVTPAVREWVKVNGRIWKLVQQVPKADCMHLRYEDLCRNPREVMNRLFEFVGLDACDVVSARDASDREAHTIGGNKIRFSSEPLNIREDTAWSRNLTEQELHTIRAIAGALSDELGYEN
mgnify:CR=1 FL=1